MNYYKVINLSSLFLWNQFILIIFLKEIFIYFLLGNNNFFFFFICRRIVLYFHAPPPDILPVLFSFSPLAIYFRFLLHHTVIFFGGSSRHNSFCIPNFFNLIFLICSVFYFSFFPQFFITFTIYHDINYVEILCRCHILTSTHSQKPTFWYIDICTCT